MPHVGLHLSDEDLVLEFQKTEDKELIGILFKRHSLLCFTVCMKYYKNETLAEDAVMQVFEKLFSTLQQHPIQNFKSWLHSVCRNHCLMELRKPQLFQALVQNEEESGDDIMEFDLFVHPEEDKQILEEKLQVMETSLNELNQLQSNCLRCFYLERLSYEQISKQSGMSLNEVKSHIQNGKRNLKLAMARKGSSYTSILFLWMQLSA
jgi:RNA polymerase sigma-70 factor (ECF subfamily)